jgi:hypothetical protein
LFDANFLLDQVTRIAFERSTDQFSLSILVNRVIGFDIAAARVKQSLFDQIF